MSKQQKMLPAITLDVDRLHVRPFHDVSKATSLSEFFRMVVENIGAKEIRSRGKGDENDNKKRKGNDGTVSNFKFEDFQKFMGINDSDQSDTTDDGSQKLSELLDKLEQGLRQDASAEQKEIIALWEDAVIAKLENKKTFYEDEEVKFETDYKEYDRILTKRLEERSASFSKGSRAGTDLFASAVDTEKAELAKRQTKKSAMNPLIEFATERINVMRKKKEEDERIVNQIKEKFVGSLKRLLEEYPNLTTLHNDVADKINNFIKYGERFETTITYAITGQSGVGKTRLARLLAEVFSLSGMLTYADFQTAYASNFIAEYVGGTTIKTEEFVYQNIEKAIFLDEAYTLLQMENGKVGSYSKDAIGRILTLLNELEGRVAFIIAGYDNEIEELFKVNEGLVTRFRTIVRMPNLSAKELCRVFYKTFLDKICKRMGSGTQKSSLNEYFQYDARRVFFDSIQVCLENEKSMGDNENQIYVAVQKQAKSMVDLADIAANQMLYQGLHDTRKFTALDVFKFFEMHYSNLGHSDVYQKDFAEALWRFVTKNGSLKIGNNGHFLKYEEKETTWNDDGAQNFFIKCKTFEQFSLKKVIDNKVRIAREERMRVAEALRQERQRSKRDNATVNAARRAANEEQRRRDEHADVAVARAHKQLQDAQRTFRVNQRSRNY